MRGDFLGLQTTRESGLSFELKLAAFVGIAVSSLWNGCDVERGQTSLPMVRWATWKRPSNTRAARPPVELAAGVRVPCTAGGRAL